MYARRSYYDVCKPFGPIFFPFHLPPRLAFLIAGGEILYDKLETFVFVVVPPHANENILEIKINERFHATIILIREGFDSSVS